MYHATTVWGVVENEMYLGTNLRFIRVKYFGQPSLTAVLSKDVHKGGYSFAITVYLLFTSAVQSKLIRSKTVSFSKDLFYFLVNVGITYLASYNRRFIQWKICNVMFIQPITSHIDTLLF